MAKNKYKLLLGIIPLLIIVIIVWHLKSFGGGNQLSSILSYGGQLVSKTIEELGYPGITILMAMESMIFPLPSELIMPFAGFLVEDGKMNLWLVILFSSLGSIIGSLISYFAGYYGGHKFILKFGRYLLLNETHLEKTEKWFQKKGDKTIFFSRFIPVVRHLISIPAGLGKMNLKKFLLYTFVGATLWNGFLAYAGYLLGQNWHLIRQYTEYFSLIIFIVLLLGIIYYISRHFRNK